MVTEKYKDECNANDRVKLRSYWITWTTTTIVGWSDDGIGNQEGLDAEQRLKPTANDSSS